MTARRTGHFLILVGLTLIVWGVWATSAHARFWWEGHTMRYRLDGLVDRRQAVRTHLDGAHLLQQPLRDRLERRWRHQAKVMSGSIMYARERIRAHHEYVVARRVELREVEERPPDEALVEGSAEPAITSTSPSSSGWYATAQCESTGDWQANTGNGYYGGLQFDSQTWDAYGDPDYAEASDAPASVQIQAAENVPYDAWPNC